MGLSSTGPGRVSSVDGLPPLELMALHVRTEAYGDGVGHALLDAAIGSSPAYLWVLGGKARAIGFYERQGFGFDGATEQEDLSLDGRMVHPAPQLQVCS